jgi:sigma-B regulation protein RsbU (phosphoserine phosphatase)
MLLGFGLIPAGLLFAMQCHQYRLLPNAVRQATMAAAGDVGDRGSAVIRRLEDAVAGATTRIMQRQAAVQAAALALLALCAAAGALWASRRVTTTLRMLLFGLERMAAGDFSVRFPVRTDDERDRLLDAFNAMVPRLEAHLHNQQALHLAQEIQQNFMPRDFQGLPGLDIAVSNISCDETGGDYVDVLFPDRSRSDRVLCAIGDVAGHGVGPALLMADARGMLRALSGPRTTLAQAARSLNRLLVADVGDSGHFMTLFLAEVDLAAGLLRWVRAGHDPAFHFDPETESFRELGGAGSALGLYPDPPFEEAATPFDRPGQMVIMATDGIWEARDPENNFFGKERLLDVVQRNAHLPSDAIKTAIVAAVRDFRRSARQSDDITLMVVKKI